MAKSAMLPTRKEVINRYGPPLAPVVISRLPVFAPVDRRKPVERTVSQKKPWGEVSVTGRLTQLHRSLLDAAIATALKWRATEDGGVLLVCDPYRIKRLMVTKSWDYRWLESLLEDLRRARVRILENGHEFPLVVTGVVTSYGRFAKQRLLQPGRLSHRSDDRRDMIYLMISAEWWSMWRDQVLVHYAEVLPEIGRLSGLGQAVVRLCLTQQPGWHIGVDHVLRAVGAIVAGAVGPAARKRRQRARWDLRADAEGLRRVGVEVEGDTITYHPPAGTYISVPARPEA